MKHQERSHARLSASGSDRWLNCTGSVQLAESIPKSVVRPRSPFADRGTALHQIAEMVMLEGLNPEPGMIVVIAPGVTYTLDEEDIEGVLFYCQYLELLIETCDYWAIEVPLDALQDLHPDLGGTADFCGVDHDGVLHVVDLKSGRGKVISPIANTQELQYAIGVLMTLAKDVVERIRAVRMTIVQPYNTSANPITFWEIGVKDLLGHAEFMRERAIEVNENPTLTIGDWCNFCPARSFCPKMNQLAQTVVQEYTPAPIVPHMKTPEELGRILASWDLLDNWIKSLYEIALRMAEQGVAIPGMKLVPKRARWEWEDPQYAAKVLEEAGVPKRAMFKVDLKSPAQMKKVVDKGLVESLIVNTSSGHNLVPSGDLIKGEDQTPALPSPKSLNLI